MVGPTRDSDSISRLSWYSEWIDHFECGVKYRSVRPIPPVRAVVHRTARVPGMALVDQVNDAPGRTVRRRRE
jgi:hypothetical protein